MQKKLFILTILVAGQLFAQSAHTFRSERIPTHNASRKIITSQFEQRSSFHESSVRHSLANPSMPLHSEIARSRMGVETFKFGTQAGYYYTDGRLSRPQPIYRFPAGYGFLNRGFGPPPFYESPADNVPLNEPRPPAVAPRPIQRGPVRL